MEYALAGDGSMTETILKDFLERASRDEPVWIGDVREELLRYGTIPFLLKTILYDGKRRDFALKLPDLPWLPEEEIFLRDFVCAEIFNILSTVGAVYMTICTDFGKEPVKRICDGLDEAFGTARKSGERTLYGTALNVNERILAHLAEKDTHSCIGGSGICPEGTKFSFSFEQWEDAGNMLETDDTAAEETAEEMSAIRAVSSGKLSELPSRAEGKFLLGIDIGGTDIKMAAARDGHLSAFRE